MAVQSATALVAAPTTLGASALAAASLAPASASASSSAAVASVAMTSTTPIFQRDDDHQLKEHISALAASGGVEVEVASDAVDAVTLAVLAQADT